LAAIISQLGTLSGAPNALANSGNVFQNLSQRQQDFESKASAEQKLQDLIGTAAVPGVPFDINNSPLMPVEPVPGTGFAGQAGLETQQVEMLKNLAGVSPETVTKGISASLFQSPQKLSGDIQQFVQARDLRLIPENTSFADFINTIKKPSVVVKVGQLKPLGKNAASFINSEGKSALATDTINSATQKGFIPKTTDQLKSLSAGKAAGSAFKSIIENAFGDTPEDHIFAGDTESTFDRLKGLVKGKFETALQTNKRVSLYNKNKEAALSGLSKLKGNVGTLTDVDIDMVRGLWPDPRFTPITQAREQFKSMTELLQGMGVSKDALIGYGFKPWMFGNTENDVQGIKDLPRPKTQADFDTLPSGTSFINPKDGKTLIKR